MTSVSCISDDDSFSEDDVGLAGERSSIVPRMVPTITTPNMNKRNTMVVLVVIAVDDDCFRNTLV